MSERDPADLFGDFTPLTPDPRAGKRPIYDELGNLVSDPALGGPDPDYQPAPPDQQAFADREDEISSGTRKMARPMMLRDDGGWGCYVIGGGAVKGEIVTVRTKKGYEREEIILEILGTSKEGGQVCKSKRVKDR